jgi:hypothetical protein
MNKTDFDEATKWNRTDPWSISTQTILTNRFSYPLTCCPMNKTQDNWIKFSEDQLRQAAVCAHTGIKIYEVVS